MGAQLTLREKLVRDSADDLSPAKLNEALDKRLTFVTTNLALIASVTTGFGLFADAGGQLRQNEGLGFALGLLLLAVVISLVGSMPNWWSRVSVSDLESVDRYFTDRYRWRSWAARIAILLFVVAAAIAAYEVWSVARGTPDVQPAVSLSFSASEDPTVTGTVTVAGLPTGSELATVLVGCPDSAAECTTGSGTQLAADNTSVDAKGEASIELEVSPVSADLTTFVLRVVGTDIDEVRTLDLAP